jgi:putative transposase
MTDGAVFQGRKRNLSQHKQIRKALGLNAQNYSKVSEDSSLQLFNNPLVFDTFDKAVATNPGATPLLHSDRGYQYTSKAFRRRILAAGMTQSMSRVARCIDNGPMEGFWGLMKREMYYGKKYKTKEELMLAIEKYIDYYTNKRVQRNLEVLTPLEFHEQKLENVA